MPVLFLAAALALSFQSADPELSETDKKVQQECGYYNFSDLKPLAAAPRRAALLCMARLTAQEGTKALPVSGDHTGATGITADGARLTFHFTVSDEDAKDLAGFDALKFTDLLREEACNDASLSGFLSVGGELVFSYVDAKGAKVIQGLVTSCP